MDTNRAKYCLMDSTYALLITYFTTGFTIGFGHCIGMCGPLVVSFSLQLKNRNIIFPQLFYHLGRTLTYMVLGGIMGAVGSFTMVAAHIVVIQKAAMIFAGVLIVFMGLSTTGWIPLRKISILNAAPDGILTNRIGKLTRSSSAIAYLPIGLILGLLPCGPVYTALLGAARAGMVAPAAYLGILTGMALMLTFGIGTVPALFLVAKLADMGWLKSRDIIYRVGGILMVGVGVYFIISAIQY